MGKSKIPSRCSMMWYGPTGSGKTTQAAELMQAIFEALGLTSVLYQIDKGGYASIQWAEDLGLMVVERWRSGVDDAFEWLNHAVQGHVRVDGKWTTPDPLPGGYFFDGATGAGEAVMEQLASYLEEGKRVGGNVDPREMASLVMKVGEGDEEVKIGGSSIAHYGMAQRVLRRMLWKSQDLPSVVVWTGDVMGGKDVERNDTLGINMPGKAMTLTLPRWFTYTFRFSVEPVSGSRPKHTLHMETYKDGMNQGLGNARLPLGVKVPNLTITPTSVVEALGKIEEAQAQALEGKKELKETLERRKNER